MPRTPRSPTCAYCSVPLRSPGSSWHLRCATCDNITLCPDCFSVGAALLPHKPTHPYQLVVTKGLPPIYDQAWGADEERSMLFALEQYGLFAWDAVADVVGSTGKSRLKCEAHYDAVYLASQAAPLPDLDVVLPKNPTPAQRSKKRQSTQVHGHKHNIRMPPWIDRIEGFQAKRGDFDVEFLEQAEDSIADLEILPTDPPEIVDMKVRLVQIYNAKVDERNRAKNVILQHPNTLQPSSSQMQHDPLRPLAQILSQADYAQLSTAFASEQALMQRFRAASTANLQEGGLHYPPGIPRPPLCLTDLPHLDQLSENERKVCALLRLTPAWFIQAREALVHSAARHAQQIQVQQPQRVGRVSLRLSVSIDQDGGPCVTIRRD